MTITGDAIDESLSEAFTLNLTTPTNATIANGAAGIGTGTIVDDDGSLLGLYINDVIVTEGNTGTTDATFTVGLSKAPTQGVNVTVDYATSNGTATAGDDYSTRQRHADIYQQHRTDADDHGPDRWRRQRGRAGGLHRHAQ